MTAPGTDGPSASSYEGTGLRHCCCYLQRMPQRYGGGPWLALRQQEHWRQCEVMVEEDETPCWESPAVPGIRNVNKTELLTSLEDHK